MYVRRAFSLVAISVFVSLGCDIDSTTPKTKVSDTRPTTQPKSAIAPAATEATAKASDIMPPIAKSNEIAATTATVAKSNDTISTTVAVAKSNDPTPTKVNAPTPKDNKDEQAAAPPIQLSGKGDQASSKFQLQAGLSTWKVTHDGRSNFKVSLLASDGKEVDMPVNEIGHYSGTQVVRVAKAGEYLLNVNGDGKWTATIEQPRPSTAPAKPLSVNGKSPTVTPFVTLPKGLCIFKMTHRGDGVFRVKLYNSEGRRIEDPAAQLGAYDGSKAITIEEEGIYIIAVYANGDWTLNIE
jgi:hypothetical protein